MIEDNLNRIKSELPSGVKLVAVSKFHPLEAILEAYQAGQTVFGENRPQELFAKAQAFEQWLRGRKSDVRAIPLEGAQGVRTKDEFDAVEWHFLGHLQTNKLKMVLPYATLVQSVDSVHLLEAIDNWGGLMGMASHTDDQEVINADFERIDTFMAYLVDLFPELKDFNQLSIGMSDDWRIAVQHGSTMVRIGTAIFGAREY